MDSEQTQPLHSPPQAIITPSPALSQASTIFDSTPRPPRQRATFARLASVDDGQYTVIKTHEDDITEASPYNDDDSTSKVNGLGINFDKEDPDDLKKGFGVNEHELPVWSSRSAIKASAFSSQTSFPQGTASEYDAHRLRNRRSFAESLKAVYDDFGPTDTCAAHQHFHHNRRNWLSVTILVLALYSTVMSAIFLIIALRGPRYNWIRKGGRMTPYIADLLTAVLAKTIELSFATVFVSFLGQVLSRRAFMKDQGRGITLAEMDMRSWVMQPGTMITHFEALKSSILSFLGVLSLVAAVVAMLYTTASESLVQPYLRYGSWERGAMQGLVKASPANPMYLAANCGTPIKSTEDASAGNTCLQIQYAAHSFYNYQRYISDWATISMNGNGSSDPAHRPKGFAMIFENTTVTAPWVDLEYSDVKNNSDKHQRIINNVTLALPHSGVPGAAWNSVNNILQPEDLDGQGVYQLQASVPSPAVNVLCAQMTQEELSPIVYTEWNNNILNTTEWPTGAQLAWYQPGYEPGGTYLNKTVVDDIFEWGEEYQTSPPVFPKLPLSYNTVLNQTAAYGREAIYLLGRDATDNYALCSLKVFMTPFCSTEYNASVVGASLEAKCDSSKNSTITMRYIDSLTNATSGSNTTSKDWPNIGSEWANSLSLNAGITDGDASNARLLTELILSARFLPTDRPSIAEALAVLASSTLLMSWQDAPFVQFWNYSSTSLEPGQPQFFNTSLRAQEYASGGSGEPGTHAFYVVLIAIFIINVVCLIDSKPIYVGADALAHFGLDKDYRNFNHGAYGTYPIEVRDVLFKTLLDGESRPCDFVNHEQPKALQYQRSIIAKYLNAPIESCVFVQNATMAFNIVLRNLSFEQGDCILYFPTTFEACKNTIKHVVETSPATAVMVESSLRSEEICEALNQTIVNLKNSGLKPRMCIIDTISSFPGIRMPFELLVQICKGHDVLSYVDGAHGIGHIPLDTTELDADFLASNCHKWLYVPRKCAVLYVPKRNHALIRSGLPTGSVFDAENCDTPSPLAAKFGSLSTLDGNNCLCVSAAINFRTRVVWQDLRGEKAIYAYLHELAVKGSIIISEALGGMDVFEETYGISTRCGFANVRLPLDFQQITKGDMALAKECSQWMMSTLIDRYNTSLLVATYDGSWWARISAQIYLDLDDFVWLGGKLKMLCDEVRQKDWQYI
ncbi:PLP-dependent transferase, partial [Aureobasidium melanogenum]